MLDEAGADTRRRVEAFRARRRRAFRRAAAAAACAFASLGGGAAGARAQSDPAAEPRWLTLGGEASASLGTDDPGFFNYTDYEQSALRLVRLSVTASLRLGEHAAVLGEVRADKGNGVKPFALYLRVRPSPRHPIDLQLGRVPPVFGAFARRSYGADNPLIGYPLGYQYLTSIRSDALPASADDLLEMKGRGWQPSYPIGSPAPNRGLPLVSAYRWDTGLQVHAGSEPVALAVAVTVGSLSNPRFRDDNSGKQVSGRLDVRPVPGLILGVSAARGSYLARTVTDALPPGSPSGPFHQRALGWDAEYSRDHWLLRTEGIWNEWQVPAVSAPWLGRPLRALATSVEGRYKLVPGLYVAARYDRLDFSRIRGAAYAGDSPWDAPVWRLEAGAGYQLRRNLLLKCAYQRDRRDTPYLSSLHAVAGQVLLWF
jgi:hypothetical protein